jgi:[CysO sulfur-carrier protein]-S-L-cysteine hydrolase
MVSRLTLSSNNLKYLVSLSKDSLPMECCALLLGETKVENLIEVIVTDTISVRNEDRSSASFSIGPEELLNVYRLAEAKKLQVVGIFHSHPSYPVPSPTDQRYMKINPVAWLIYSTTTEEFGAFIFEDSIRKVELQVRV